MRKDVFVTKDEMIQACAESSDMQEAFDLLTRSNYEGSKIAFETFIERYKFLYDCIYSQELDRKMYAEPEGLDGDDEHVLNVGVGA